MDGMSNVVGTDAGSTAGREGVADGVAAAAVEGVAGEDAVGTGVAGVEEGALATDEGAAVFGCAAVPNSAADPQPARRKRAATAGAVKPRRWPFFRLITGIRIMRCAPRDDEP